jgi:hypothetical protein
MRTRRRAAILVASAAAFGVGLIAFTGSAAAVAPTCTPPDTTTNDSCVKLNVTPANPGGTVTNSRLFVRARTIFTSPGNTSAGGRTKTVTLDFDNDFALNQGTIPTCATTDLTGKTVAQAYATCGPPAGTSKNAYLSTQVAPTGFGCNANPCTSGLAHAVPAVNACVLVFKGPVFNGNPTVTLFARAPVSNTACAGSPSTVTGGTTSVILRGNITTSPIAGFGKRLTVPNVDTAPLPLDDFFAYIKRGNYFTAKCTATPWRLRGLFAYSGGPPSPEPSDVANSTQACS